MKKVGAWCRPSLFCGCRHARRRGKGASSVEHLAQAEYGLITSTQKHVSFGDCKVVDHVLSVLVIGRLRPHFGGIIGREAERGAMGMAV